MALSLLYPLVDPVFALPDLAAVLLDPETHLLL